MKIEGVNIIPAYSAGESLKPRGSLRVGDLVVLDNGKKGRDALGLITSEAMIQGFYAGLGIELWGFPSTWDDTPRKPLIEECIEDR